MKELDMERDGEWHFKTHAKNRTAGGNCRPSEAYNLNVIKGRSVTMMMDREVWPVKREDGEQTKIELEGSASTPFKEIYMTGSCNYPKRGLQPSNAQLPPQSYSSVERLATGRANQESPGLCRRSLGAHSLVLMRCQP